MNEMTPLVGFHGRVNDSGIVQLGLIFFDKVATECNVKIENDKGLQEMSMIEGMSDSSKSKIIEGMITGDERERAKTLEAIMLYDKIQKSTQSKKEILTEIWELLSMPLINVDNDGLPKTEKDL